MKAITIHAAAAILALALLVQPVSGDSKRLRINQRRRYWNKKAVF